MVISGNDTLKWYTDRKGNLTKGRQKVHRKILSKLFRDKSSIDKKDPDIYFFGGVPACYKTSVLTKYVKEKATVVSSEFQAGASQREGKEVFQIQGLSIQISDGTFRSSA